MTTLLSTTSYMDYKLIDLEKRTTRALDAVSISFRVNISFSVNRVTLKKKEKMPEPNAWSKFTVST